MPDEKNPYGGHVIDLRAMDMQGAGASGGKGSTPAGTGEEGGTPATKAKTATGEEGKAPAGAGTGAPTTGDKYAIPQVVKEKYPDLVELIKTTESMNDEEREYWFQILPIMTEEQIKKFRDILINEKEQLSKLDEEYENELTKLNEKHLVEWKEIEIKEKREALTKAETVSEKVEAEEEALLLQQLEQL